MHHRDEIVRRYGCETFADLLDVSNPLPMMPGDKAASYVARHPDGTWFVWEVGPLSHAPEQNDKRRATV